MVALALNTYNKLRCYGVGRQLHPYSVICHVAGCPHLLLHAAYTALAVLCDKNQFNYAVTRLKKASRIVQSDNENAPRKCTRKPEHVPSWLRAGASMDFNGLSGAI